MLSNNAPTTLMHLTAKDGSVADTIKDNKWSFPLGAKPKINKFESPFKNSNGCIEFSGGQDRMQLHIDNPKFDMRNTDWTISFWLKYSEATAGNWCPIIAYENYFISPINDICTLWINVLIGAQLAHASIGRGVAYTAHINPPQHDDIIDGINFDGHQWHHIALVVHNSTIMLFVDGRKKIENTHHNIPLIGYSYKDRCDLCIGNVDAGNGDRFAYQGYIDDFVIINNLALWTKDFTPPSTYLTIPKAIYVDINNAAWTTTQ